MSARIFLVLATFGFVASAVLHLASFLPFVPPPHDAVALALFAGAFVPLVAMLVRVRRAARGGGSRPRRVVDWRAMTARVPSGIRTLLVGVVLYTLMNLVLSLIATGGVTAEVEGDTRYLVSDGVREEVSREVYDTHRRLTIRLLSGHLLLFYLVPLTYFRFVDSQRFTLSASLTPPDGIA